MTIMAKPKEKDRRQHAADLANLLIYSIEIESTPLDVEEVHQIASLLLMSAGIEGVRFDRSRYDLNYGWCSEADRFQHHQNILEKNLVDSLTQFLFIWSSCEAAINTLVPSRAYGAPRGRVNGLCAFLKHEFEPRMVSSEYRDRLDELHTLAVSTSHYSNQLRFRESAPHIGISGYAIASIYSLRNSLAHGSLTVPMSAEDEEQFLEVRLIDCCSHLVLHTLQMTFTAYFAKYQDSVYLKGRAVEFEHLMKVYHLEFSVDEFTDTDDGLRFQ